MLLKELLIKIKKDKEIIELTPENVLYFDN